MPSALRILVVEDHDLQRAMLVQTLISLGVGVVDQAANGREAKRLLASIGGQIDLVIADMMMPDLDGIELLSAMREMAASLPIILCSIDKSTLLSAHAIAQASGLRVLGMLTKPVTRDALSRLIAKLERA